MLDKQKLGKIVGPRNVVYKEAALEGYSKDMSFVNQVRPACVVRPKQANEVQKIIKLANKTQTPLVPVSSGPPISRGIPFPVREAPLSLTSAG